MVNAIRIWIISLKIKSSFYALVVIKNKATSFGSGSNQSH